MEIISRRAGYLEARSMVSERGLKLPSNVMHDDWLVRTKGWKKLWDGYPGWAEEIIVYPEKNWLFQKGRDVRDSEIGWILPSSYIPREALERKGVGLFVRPESIERETSGIIVHPAKIVILHPFIQENGGCGSVDEETRVPLDLPGRKRDLRRFYRIEGAGVRAIVRLICSSENDYWRRGVSGLYGPKDLFGVIGVHENE